MDYINHLFLQKVHTLSKLPLTQNDLWCPVVPGGDHGAVVLIVKGSGAKVNEPNVRVFHHPHILLLQKEGPKDVWGHTGHIVCQPVRSGPVGKPNCADSEGSCHLVGFGWG